MARAKSVILTPADKKAELAILRGSLKDCAAELKTISAERRTILREIKSNAAMVKKQYAALDRQEKAVNKSKAALNVKLEKLAAAPVASKVKAPKASAPALEPAGQQPAA